MLTIHVHFNGVGYTGRCPQFDVEAAADRWQDAFKATVKAVYLAENDDAINEKLSSRQPPPKEK